MKDRAHQASVLRGAEAEVQVRNRLAQLGLQFITRIETGFSIVRDAGRIVGARPKRSVAGDWRALVPPTGRSVLMEVKYRGDAKLSLGDFQQHQIYALREHAWAGGVSLVGFVCPHGVAVMQWPFLDLMKGAPLSWAAMQPLSLEPTHGRLHPIFLTYGSGVTA